MRFQAEPVTFGNDIQTLLILRETYEVLYRQFEFTDGSCVNQSQKIGFVMFIKYSGNFTHVPCAILFFFIFFIY